jgi:hypothetical protein
MSTVEGRIHVTTVKPAEALTAVVSVSGAGAEQGATVVLLFAGAGTGGRGPG